MKNLCSCNSIFVQLKIVENLHWHPFENNFPCLIKKILRQAAVLNLKVRRDRKTLQTLIQNLISDWLIDCNTTDSIHYRGWNFYKMWTIGMLYFKLSLILLVYLHYLLFCLMFFNFFCYLQRMTLCVQNALKLTYVDLEFQIFPGVISPEPR